MTITIAIALAGVLSFCQAATVGKRDTQPNIIWIFGDDYGLNDIGFKDSSIQTPNLDELANTGIIFNNAYVAPQCSPSRSSFLSGRDPYKTAMQHSVILDTYPGCMPLQFKFLPEYLQELGYETHAVGKWHLGYCRWECTPTYRGFDTFYGGYSGEGYYINHTTAGEAFDWHDQEDIDKSTDGTHSQTLVEARTLDVLDGMDGSKPFFFYVAFHNVHSPLMPLQEYEDLYSDVESEARRRYLGLVSGMDAVIGSIVQRLKDNGQYDNTIILFSSDNGGDADEGNNYPYRGTKASLWEGGCRATSFAHSPLQSQSGISVDGLFHVTDWLPTIVSLAGGTPPTDVDGLDQTDMVMNGGDSVRTGFVYNLDREFLMGQPTYGEMAVRNERYKVIWGFPGQCDDIGLEATQIFNIPAYQDELKKYCTDHGISMGRKRQIPGVDLDYQLPEFCKDLEANAKARRSAIRDEDDDDEGDDDEGQRRLERGGPFHWTNYQAFFLYLYANISMVTEEQFSAGTGTIKLFDLQEDPTEQTNLADSDDADAVAAKAELIKELQDAYNDGGYLHQTLTSQRPSSEFKMTDDSLYPGWCDDLLPLPSR